MSRIPNPFKIKWKHYLPPLGGSKVQGSPFRVTLSQHPRIVLYIYAYS
jgi:hypothetical protein